MGKKVDIKVGEIFGKLTILKEVEPYVDNSGYVRRQVLCSCECNNEKIIRISDLKSGKTISCGCHRKQNSKELSTIHGLKYTTEYNIWCNMKQRCSNPNINRYKDYGGRGIKVCDRWLNSFENFYNDMGSRPSFEHSIDRIDNNGNYEPGNVRWATPQEQRINQRRMIK